MKLTRRHAFRAAAILAKLCTGLALGAIYEARRAYNRKGVRP